MFLGKQIQHILVVILQRLGSTFLPCITNKHEMKYERCMDATVFCVSEIDHELILASSVHKLTEAKNLWVRKS